MSDKNAAVKNVQRQPSHAEAGERMRAFAMKLKSDRSEAKAFREKTGVYNEAGELTAAYR